MSDKKKAKTVAHATMVWEREQLKAAVMMEQVDKALATVEQYKDELTDEQIADVLEHAKERRKDIEEYILKAKLKFVNKLAPFGIEPTFKREPL